MSIQRNNTFQHTKATIAIAAVIALVLSLGLLGPRMATVSRVASPGLLPAEPSSTPFTGSMDR